MHKAAPAVTSGRQAAYGVATVLSAPQQNHPVRANIPLPVSATDTSETAVGGVFGAYGSRPQDFIFFRENY